MHPALEAIRDATRGAPFEGDLWVVGGAVRDELLGLPPSNDLDLVTRHSSAELARLLFAKGVSTIPPVTYERFGTAMIRVHHTAVEIVTARKESYDETSRKPNVEPATLEEDARRRDFTVNALLRNLHTEELYDPLGVGLQDLETNTLRTPLEPRATFHDDPLRMLRAVRFQWQLHFAPASGLLDAIGETAERLKIISAERIRDELVKMLLLEDADHCLTVLMHLNLLDQFAPEFRTMVGVDQGAYHHLDVWNHTLLVVRNAGPGDLVLTLGALLHDVGKPATRILDEKGSVRFFGHESVGASITTRILRRLKFPNEQIDQVAALVKNHMRLGSAPVFTPTAARRLVRDLDGQIDQLLKLVDADSRGLKKGIRSFDLEPIRRQIEAVQRTTPKTSLESPLSGQEIMSLLSLEPGPEVGKCKKFLCEKVLEGDLDPGDKERALEMLRAGFQKE